MNILIRNYPKNADTGQLAAIINLLTNEFAKELEQKKKILFDDEKLKNKFIAELQPNGNLCFDFNELED
jgi:hypothetical protein